MIIINEIIDCILTRRSIRSFTDKKISREELEIIVKAATYAPSARNLQMWHFTVVQKPEMLKKLAYVIAKKLGRDESYDFYSPNALIIASAKRECTYAREDCACALENIFLAAHSLNIGSVWINQLNGICDEPEIRAVLNELNVPDDNLVWGMAALGYPKAKPQTPLRKNNTVNWVV